MQNLNLEIKKKKKPNQDQTNRKKKPKRMDNLHMLQPKNKENHKPIWAH